METRNILSAAVLASLLSACNVDVPKTEPPPVPLPVGAMHVTSYDSELIRAEIRVYPVDNHLRSYGDPLVIGETNDRGQILLEPQIEDQIIMVQVGFQGHYIEEATGKRIDLGPQDYITAVTHYDSSEPLDITVSGFTHMQAAYASCLAREFQENKGNAMSKASGAITSWLGVDAVNVEPVNPTADHSSGLLYDHGVHYGMAAAGVSQFMVDMANAAGVEPHSANFRSIDFYKIAHRDILDDPKCALDGQALNQGGETIALGVGGVEFSSSTYRTDLGRSIIDFSRSDRNKTAVTGDDQEYLVKVMGLADAVHITLFANERAVPIDEEGPTLTLLHPQGKVFNGVITRYEVEAEDFSGIQKIDLYIRRDDPGFEETEPEFFASALIRDDENPYWQFINTENYDDGRYSFIFNAVDLLGNESVTEHRIRIHNHGPIIELTSGLESEYTNEIEGRTLELTIQTPRGLRDVYVDGDLFPHSEVDAEAGIYQVSATPQLWPGRNTIPVNAIDEVGNSSVFQAIIIVDQVKPRALTLVPNDTYAVKYSYSNDNPDHSGYELLDLSGGAANPIYLDETLVRMNGEAITPQNLVSRKIPYVRFRVTDFNSAQADGIYTPPDQLEVTVSYYRNDVAVFENRLLDSLIDEPDAYLFPLIEETLGENFFLVHSSVEHRLEFNILDWAGNVGVQTYSWRNRYFTNLAIQHKQNDGRYSANDFANLPSTGDWEDVYHYQVTNNSTYTVRFEPQQIGDVGSNYWRHEWTQQWREHEVRRRIQRRYAAECEGPYSGTGSASGREYFDQIRNPSTSVSTSDLVTTLNLSSDATPSNRGWHVHKTHSLRIEGSDLRREKAGCLFCNHSRWYGGRISKEGENICSMRYINKRQNRPGGSSRDYDEERRITYTTITPPTNRSVDHVASDKFDTELMVWNEDDWRWEYQESVLLQPGESVKVGMGVFFPEIDPKGDTCVPTYRGTSCDIRLRLRTMPGALFMISPQSVDGHDISHGRYTIRPDDVISVIGRR